MRRGGIGAVIRNVGTLSASTAVTSGLGFVFWSLAARNAPPAAVGLAAAAISASTLLASISMLGFGSLLIGEVASGQENRHSLATTALLVVGLVSTLLGLVFASLGGAVSQEFGRQTLGIMFMVVFAATCLTTAVGQLIDQLLIGSLRSELSLARNSVFAVAKLVALALVAPSLASDSGLLVFGVWPLGSLLSLAGLGAFLAWRPIGISLGKPELRLLRRVGSTALGHHALNLSAQAPGLALPVLVTSLLSASANAYFYTGWMIATVAFVPLNALSVTLFALAAREPDALRSRARLTLLLGLLEGLVAVAVVELLASWLLAGFGKTYSVEASSSLRILILAVIPTVIKVHFISLSRVTRRVRSGGVLMAAGACLELGAATIGGYVAGLPGLSTGWLIGISLEAVLMFPRVWHVVAPRQGVTRRLARKLLIATDAR